MRWVKKDYWKILPCGKSRHYACEKPTEESQDFWAEPYDEMEESLKVHAFLKFAKSLEQPDVGLESSKLFCADY